jgi:ankyrin repeat protein
MTIDQAIAELPMLNEEEIAEVKAAGFDESHMESFSILEHFIRKGNMDLLKRALDGGVDVNVQNSYGWTLLHIAIRYNQMAMVQYLVEEKGANIDLQDGVGWTPLMEGIMDDMADIVGYLVGKGADKTIANQRGATAPMLVMKFGRQSMSQYF